MSSTQRTKITRLEHSRLPWGNNPMMTLETERFGIISVIRQGGLNFWGFWQRGQLSAAEAREFDSACDQLWEESK